MELSQVAVRALFAYAALLALLHVSGKHAVAQANAFDFLLALGQLSAVQASYLGPDRSE